MTLAKGCPWGLWVPTIVAKLPICVPQQGLQSLQVQRQTQQVPLPLHFEESPETLNRGNPNTCVIHPCGASEIHLRAA